MLILCKWCEINEPYIQLPVYLYNEQGKPRVLTGLEEFVINIQMHK